MTTHEYDWRPLGRHGRRCPCGAEEFEFTAAEWAEITRTIERGAFLDRLRGTAEVQAKRLHDTLDLPDTLVVRFDERPVK